MCNRVSDGIPVGTFHAGAAVHVRHDSGKVGLVVWKMGLVTGALGTYVGGVVVPLVGNEERLYVGRTRLYDGQACAYSVVMGTEVGKMGT